MYGEHHPERDSRSIPWSRAVRGPVHLETGCDSKGGLKMNAYFNPFHDLEALRRGLDELFTADRPGGWSRRSAFLPGRAARAYPLLNVSAEKDKVFVDAFAPGLDMDSLEVSIDRNVLTLAGQKQTLPDVAPEAYHRNERAAGSFVRTLRLDFEVDEDKVEAEYEDGILRVALPKAQSALPRKVEIRVK
jgi:HSP20 family protein